MQPYVPAPYGPQEPPTNPGTPGAKAVAQEVAAAAIEYRGLRFTIPSALLIAAITAFSTVGATRLSAPEPTDAGTMRRIADELSEIRAAQREVLKRLNDAEATSQTARSVDAIEKANIRAELEKLRTR